MSRKTAQEYSVLNLNRFNEMCCVLGIKELSCYDPDKKAIERAFRLDSTNNLNCKATLLKQITKIAYKINKKTVKTILDFYNIKN